MDKRYISFPWSEGNEFSMILKENGNDMVKSLLEYSKVFVKRARYCRKLAEDIKNYPNTKIEYKKKKIP